MLSWNIVIILTAFYCSLYSLDFCWIWCLSFLELYCFSQMPGDSWFHSLPGFWDSKIIISVNCFCFLSSAFGIGFGLYQQVGSEDGFSDGHFGLPGNSNHQAPLCFSSPTTTQLRLQLPLRRMYDGEGSLVYCSICSCWVSKMQRLQSPFHLLLSIASRFMSLRCSPTALTSAYTLSSCNPQYFFSRHLFFHSIFQNFKNFIVV